MHRLRGKSCSRQGRGSMTPFNENMMPGMHRLQIPSHPAAWTHQRLDQRLTNMNGGCPKETNQLSANSRRIRVTTAHPLPLTSHFTNHPRKKVSAFSGCPIAMFVRVSISSPSFDRFDGLNAAAWLAYVHVDYDASLAAVR